ncbi:MarR family winged helix-turn-helix transcriptional regulator [Lentilactobacillus parabuchneri]|uniref:MarR family winged helix-turn-helix transcriptional regulator n=1 Tax=Lentilactobacillus parabuchneri TaxID=152331 RepID=UPI001C4EA37E|nr:MarR family transcriptional regulator [Lentilactobacillus parabuchneri]MBW0263220.1 MarR family transcriptional regulator [Lentilactobacillus parabuchneri]
MAEILRPIGIIARSLDSIANVEFKQFDLTKGQHLYLVRICENPGIFQDQLAELIKVDRTTAARAIKKLEEKGFVTKRADTANKKIRRIYPTEKARRTYPNILRENVYSNQVALKSLSTDEADELERLLEKVSDNIDEDWHYVKKGNRRTY